jgi:hypothetical protein
MSNGRVGYSLKKSDAALLEDTRFSSIKDVSEQTELEENDRIIKYLKSCYYSELWKLAPLVLFSLDSFYKKEEYYKFIGVPSPYQYRAIYKLKSIFPHHLRGHKLETYDTVNEGMQQCYLKFLDDIDKKTEFGEPDNIVFTCGSFWGRNDNVRKIIIDKLNHLSSIGVSINIYANTSHEDVFNGLSSSINIDNTAISRILIHYILVHYKNGQTRLFYDYPHTESVLYRLAMVLENDDISRLKDKQKLFSYLEKMITDSKKRIILKY